MTPVTPAPSRSPLSGVLDRRKRISSRLLPATFFSPSPISVIPNRKSATPPRSDITFDASILFPFSGLLKNLQGLLDYPFCRAALYLSYYIIAYEMPAGQVNRTQKNARRTGGHLVKTQRDISRYG